VAKFAEAHDDWDDVLEGVGKIQLTLAVQESIIDSENSAELMYELAKDPKELKRICNLTPLAAAKEIGKFESRFLKPSASSEKQKTSSAPTPVTPVRTRGASSSKSIYDENLSQSDYEALRREQLKNRAGF
jgi:hypothetical protein